ncbi:G-type lectin S-receptor-like serine/threonine-protein kinase [Glycine soja]|uniref:non-specific serine/threonine protein kinase n=1 Tax=Glycine soja TaxID=3848 RepID=A0A445FD07_GLYSO|nr:G-type lectin S-receptor-like serine/threonine-protein kinase [Glycine soja]
MEHVQVVKGKEKQQGEPAQIDWIRDRLAFKDNIRAGREVGDQLIIEWSVATASSLEYSTMSDYDDQRVMIFSNHMTFLTRQSYAKDEVNGSRQWVPQWAAVPNPSNIAGVCGNEVCNLDRSKTKELLKLTDCDCVASVYGLNEERSFCWVLRSFSFGGFQDTSSTLFLKPWKALLAHDVMGSAKEKAAIIPIVLSMVVLIVLLSLLLYFSVHRKRTLKREMESSFILSGAPMSFTYRNLQIRTSNFSQLLGTGGFGSVYKGSLGDGTLVAVKKLDRVLPHGKEEFITEVNTIGSMHHMNLVRLCGYCSEGSHRLLVYEFMKNGSLDKWIFPSYQGQDRLLDWKTRLNIAIATAQGIAYFHEQCRDRIIHCDIKPENILVDENFCPKVSDFGLAKLMGREHSHVVTMVRGTKGPLGPSRRFLQKAVASGGSNLARLGELGGKMRGTNQNGKRFYQVKVKGLDVTSLKELGRLMGPLQRQAFRKVYGKILDLAATEVFTEAVVSLAQYYDQPLRCFTFGDFQMVPTIEEFEEILGSPLGGRKPYLFSGFLPSLSKIAAVVGDSAKELDRTKQTRNGVVGLPRKYLEGKARDMASQEKWGPFADILALLIFGVVLFPNVDGLVDLAAIAFLAYHHSKESPVVAILADLFDTFDRRCEKNSARIVCCLPALCVWLISHLFRQDTRHPCTLQSYRSCAEKGRVDWDQHLAGIGGSMINWFPRWKEGKEGVLFSCGDYPNVPLIGTRGCINYNPALAIRQLGYPMRGAPTEESLSPFLVRDLGAQGLKVIQRIHKAWRNPLKKDKELRGIRNGVIGGYHGWLRIHARGLDWLSKLKVIDEENFEAPEEDEEV